MSNPETFVAEMPVAQPERFSRLKKLIAPAAAALAVTACLPASSAWTGPENGIKVALVGDSQLDQAQKNPAQPGGDPISRLHALGFTTSYSFNTGACIGDTQDEYYCNNPTSFQGFPAPNEDIDVSVTALGTNDNKINPATGEPIILFSQSTANYEAHLNETGAECDVIVGIVETDNPEWGLNITGPVFNNYLRDLAVLRNGVYIDWAAEVAANPSYVGSDGVHQTAEGKGAYLDNIEQGVQECAAKIAA
jgi:hypothetical protein